MQLTFSKKMNDLNTQDALMFSSYLFGQLNSEFEKTIRIAATKFNIETSKEFPLMETLTIELQIWQKGQNGFGSRCVYSCYREKDYSCSNERIEYTEVFIENDVCMALVNGEEHEVIYSGTRYKNENTWHNVIMDNKKFTVHSKHLRVKI